MEFAFSMKEVDMKENGKMIRCMDLENFSMRMDLWHMRGSGKTVNFMELEKCIVLNPQSSPNHLILGISIFLKKNGYLMKEVFSMTKSKDGAP